MYGATTPGSSSDSVCDRYHDPVLRVAVKYFVTLKGKKIIGSMYQDS